MTNDGDEDKEQDILESPAESTEYQGEFSNGSTRWAKGLFWVTLIAILMFFWWLLIYSHGVDVNHG